MHSFIQKNIEVFDMTSNTPVEMPAYVYGAWAANRPLAPEKVSPKDALDLEWVICYAENGRMVAITSSLTVALIALVLLDQLAWFAIEEDGKVDDAGAIDIVNELYYSGLPVKVPMGPLMVTPEDWRKHLRKIYARRIKLLESTTPG